MRITVCLAAVMILCTPLGVVLAQNAPEAGTAAAPATTPAPAPPPANAPAPAAQSTNPPAASAPAPDTSASPPAKPNEKTATDSAPKPKKKKAGMTRRQEIEKSIDSGTVPSRYRNAVPKEYQHYIPFSKD